LRRADRQSRTTTRRPLPVRRCTSGWARTLPTSNTLRRVTECHEEGLPGGTLRVSSADRPNEAPEMLYAGLHLSRGRLDVHLLEEGGATKEVTAVSPDANALRALAAWTARHGEPVRAAIESMNGARFVHDTLELAGWDVEIADAQKLKGLDRLTFNAHIVETGTESWRFQKDA